MSIIKAEENIRFLTIVKSTTTYFLTFSAQEQWHQQPKNKNYLLKMNFDIVFTLLYTVGDVADQNFIFTYD